MATEEPSKNALYFVCKRLYLKNELGDPHFLLLKSDKQAKTKLTAKFEKTYWGGFRATLVFFNCEGGNESAPEIFFKTLQRVLPERANHSFLRYMHLKTKYSVFLDALLLPW